MLSQSDIPVTKTTFHTYNRVDETENPAIGVQVFRSPAIVIFHFAQYGDFPFLTTGPHLTINIRVARFTIHTLDNTVHRLKSFSGSKKIPTTSSAEENKTPLREYRSTVLSYKMEWFYTFFSRFCSFRKEPLIKQTTKQPWRVTSPAVCRQRQRERLWLDEGSTFDWILQTVWRLNCQKLPLLLSQAHLEVSQMDDWLFCYVSKTQLPVVEAVPIFINLCSIKQIFLHSLGACQARGHLLNQMQTAPATFIFVKC